MLEKEKIIREQRLIEATTKDYIGLQGKFGIILKYLGEPIVSHHHNNYSYTEFPDVYEIPNDDMPTMDLEEETVEIGRIFQGLKYGINMEIKYLDHSVADLEEANKILEVYYENRLVYQEIDHNLKCFVPMKRWEEMIEHLYDKVKDRKNKENAQNILSSKIKQEKLNYLEKLRRLWGI